MSDDRMLGELIADVRWIKKEVSEIRTDVKGLTTIRFKIAGGAAVIAAIVSYLLGH